MSLRPHITTDFRGLFIFRFYSCYFLTSPLCPLVFFRVSPFFDRERGTRARVLEIFPSGVRMSAALANFSQEINKHLVLLKQNFTDTQNIIICLIHSKKKEV